jgi:predicted RNase H-like nuclease
MHVIAGVDLAWMGQRNPTAIAVGKLTPGVVELSSIIAGLHGTQSVIEALDGIVGLHGVAIDGPLIIRNEAGQRECERQIGVSYGSRKASCHTSNLGRFPDAAGTRLSSHLTAAGFGHLAPRDQKWQLECYPHPALIEIFGLPQRLAYKKGTVIQKRSGQIELGKLILSLAESIALRLRVPDALRIYADQSRISTLQGAQLKHNEDVLDAILCMYIGTLYQSGHAHSVFGTAVDGYIYVPTKRCR